MCAMAKNEDLEERAEVEEQAAVVPNPHAPVTPLTVPCSLEQLRAWVRGCDALVVAGNSSVSATATTVSVA